MKSKSEIFSQLQSMLSEVFEINPNEISETSDIYQDLDLDSIDAIDLAVRLQDLSGTKISPYEFKSVATISDIIEFIFKNAHSKTASV
ncbi:acyl carrier protein [Pleionea sediminis]|uniref:acyl carrier protein n=1 Tax=Pleionea sediminis TaxID=2569479 RepID=UPI00118623BE|nr:acyl carrier protein [Pleionea sediminis]